MPGGDFVTLDMRLRFPISPRGWWHMTAGGGWVSSGKALPFAAGSVGTRFGGPVRLGFDIDLRYYRVPSVLRTAEYRFGELLALFNEESRVDWERAIAIAFIVELPTSRSR
jgi:hypothetical protein